MLSETTRLFHLLAGGVSVVIDARGSGVPRIVHWGAPLERATTAGLEQLVSASQPQIVSNSIDNPVPLGVLPEQAAGWAGTPGIAGHRDGTHFTPLLALTDASVGTSPDIRFSDRRFVATLADVDAGLVVELVIELSDSGVLRSRATVTGTSAGVYTLDGLQLALPVPMHAQEILDFTGRHMRESSPQRHDFTFGTHVNEGRRGRTGHDASLLYAVGSHGFGFQSGEVWGVQVAWSGNHRTYAERMPNGRGVIGGGELLLPGEIRLNDGDSYTSPWLYASYGSGLDDLSTRFHAFVRSRVAYPTTPRPVVLNTWEAVYFDQDLDTLLALADRAAEVGVERFVLDDGWFHGRRDKSAGLGDWRIDDTVWPEGLDPLVQRVRSLGMQFGLWFEPEMINPDSDAAREHPEWIMSPGHRLPPTARFQQVLDLANPAAFAHVLESMSGLIARYDIDFIKWDHNRDLVDAGHPGSGVAGVHDQTLAFYRLIDDLRARFPKLEIEACSSGGARADLEVLERSDRIWASDCIDALERQRIERWTGLTVPPELIGSHVGAAIAHSTKRVQDISFRAGTAIFGSFGIEQNLSLASADEVEQLTQWIELYKKVRAWMHRGTVVRGDHPDPAYWLRGVVSADRDEALYSFVAMATSVQNPPGMVRLPGLDPRRSYRVAPLVPGSGILTFNHHAGPAWWVDGIELSGHALARVGLQAPALAPEHLALVHVTSITATEG
ncbi:alpha-galactosidase [Cryobacterium adonitolivorans]|uniref:Alpha-galactosidase n=1 Tax=Cryobacterium adonitolivorans TaxID=1259189 RepID=A0A4R8W4L1_9MICO|nr:alpha-galactosidase [Cryobacterium adonitolivorans]TFB99547.1 alpha-galactosidase [Cryobacterium adonitolivorans]